MRSTSGASELPTRPIDRDLWRRLSAADRRAFDAVAETHLPGLESLLPRLSRSANYGVLWFGTAGALGLTGRPPLRRAALRGTVAIMAASPLVNMIVKHAFRRRRPLLDLVPPGRIRWRVPSSHAFPSGHSASAAAFATGVALEAPRRVSVPIALMAAGVAFSRIYTGAHYPGDVLGGVGVGVAAGLGTRLVWPSRPSAGHLCRTPAEQHPVDARGDGLVAVLSPGEEALADLLRAELPAAEIVQAQPADDLTGLCDAAAGRARVLAVAGGDDAVNAGAAAALHHRVPLLTVPGAIFDHFSRALGVETAAAAIAAYRGGRRTVVDVGRISRPGGSELVFLNTAGLGAYAELVERRERLQGRLGKWPATAVAAVRTLRRARPVQIEVDGRPRTIWLGFVGNCRYGSRGAAPTWRDRLDDGLLDVRLIEAADRARTVRAVAAIMLGHLRIVPGYAHWKTGSLRLRVADGELRVARDGDPCAVRSPVEFGKHAASLQVFCPH